MAYFFNLGRSKFELSAAHEKFGVWTGPKLQNHYTEQQENKIDLFQENVNQYYKLNNTITKEVENEISHKFFPLFVEIFSLIVAPWKFDVLIIFCFKNIKFPRGNYQPIVPQQKHSIVWLV